MSDHIPTGSRIVERDLYATGYAPMSVEYTVFCCSCGDEYASKPDLLAHLIEEVTMSQFGIESASKGLKKIMNDENAYLWEPYGDGARITFPDQSSRIVTEAELEESHKEAVRLGYR